MLEENNNGTETLSEKEGAGIMGLVQWRKAQKSEVAGKISTIQRSVSLDSLTQRS